MKVDFRYNKESIKAVEGYIYKGLNYRCNYTRFNSPYRRTVPGTEVLEIYNFEPKTKTRASVILLHGLGSRNIKFLLWMGCHLAAAGVHCAIPVLPGNYTRVEHGSVSGRSFVYPDLRQMIKFWEHAVVDIRSTIDFLQVNNKWFSNNCIMGYCLGGMLTSIVASVDKRINQVIFMTTGGYMPKILHESPAANVTRKLFKSGYKDSDYLYDREKLYETYKQQLPLVRKMPLRELLLSEDIHTLFKIDPIAYAHYLDKSKVTFIDALLDETIPLRSRMTLFKEMKGAKRYILPMTHGSWLPFERFVAQYILLKLNINDKESIKKAQKNFRSEKEFFG
ncbi:alpha/beta hydrolase [Clostridium cellulovorans]|uniref:Alpha/beta hydrolase n=1 Tax=Clostridium cellulovorans (strain ATCC 35296 / DSM 3052 / OCM 3 / 743B) TaxID=573061 RepID=D9SSS2_CLOC7|nr:alpha/beta hydrolase [Clostridium cellulovorans]ADL52584.1 hypothetical protein Clocel_2889 [Clostridium cellulovorans 743B]